VFKTYTQHTWPYEEWDVVQDTIDVPQNDFEGKRSINLMQLTWEICFSKEGGKRENWY
jgi:hypothetical protein